MLLRRVHLSVAALALLGAAAWGCGSNDTSLPSRGGAGGGAVTASITTGSHESSANIGSTVSGTGGGPFVTAAHHPYPQVFDHGGPKLTHLHMVTVVQNGDAQTAMLQAYGDWIVGSRWLTAVGSEYGIAGASHELATLPAPSPSNVSSLSIPDSIAASIAAGDLPATTPDTVYIMVYPQDVTIDGAACPPGSPYGLGYHEEAETSAGHLTYAVVQSCHNQDPAQLGNVISHELIEAATDVRPEGDPGLQLALDDPWTFNPILLWASLAVHS